MTVGELIEMLNKYDGKAEIGLKIMTGNGNDYEIADITELDYVFGANSLLIG